MMEAMVHTTQKAQRMIVHTKSAHHLCTVIVGGNVEQAAGLAKGMAASKAAVVCCQNTLPIARRIEAAATGGGLDCTVIAMDDGEENKTLATVENLFNEFQKAGLDRDAVVIAVGGGVVGDVAGFVASAFLRGVRLIHVPTTLLAMVDSSIGGKTGVNLEGGKNLIGAFYQPHAVVIDFSTLQTLPPQEVRQGFAEIAKAACIASPALFAKLEQNATAMVSLEPSVLEEVVKQAVEIKAGIISQDERESRIPHAASRMFLNFGHSIGHGLEKASKFSIRHGDAVSIGMAGECGIAVRLGILEQSDAERIERLLSSLGLPTSAPGVDANSVLNAMEYDKKNRGGGLVMALPSAIGSPTIVQGVPREDALDEIMKLAKGGD